MHGLDLTSSQRILIIGNNGSGKSTLASRLGAVLGLPVFHLDRHFWQPGWVETPTAEWEARVTELISAPRWIMDGNYGGTMQRRLEAADTVVFLDMSTVLCMSRVINRRVRYRGRSRPDITDGCPERLSADFLHWVASYRRTRRPTIMRRLSALENASVIVLNRPQEAHRLTSARS